MPSPRGTRRRGVRTGERPQQARSSRKTVRAETPRRGRDGQTPADRVRVFGQLGELGPVDNLSNAIAESAVGRFGVRAAAGLLERAYSSPRLVSMIPDTKLPYVTLPTALPGTASP